MHKQIKQNPQTNQMKPNQTHGQMHTRDITEREIARGKESVRDWGQEVLTYDGWQRGSRRWRWQSVLGAAVASMRGGGGGVVLRVIKNEGLFESLVLRVINLNFVVRVSWEFFQFRVFLVVERFWPIVYWGVFFFLITNPELRFIKRGSIWIEAAFIKTQLCKSWSRV